MTMQFDVPVAFNNEFYCAYFYKFYWLIRKIFVCVINDVTPAKRLVEKEKSVLIKRLYEESIEAREVINYN